MGASKKNVMDFALIGFLLLAVLFGMQIMTFIFGNIADIGDVDDLTSTVRNRTSVYINDSIFTIPEASVKGFTGGFTVITAYNSSEGLIATANYSIDADLGTIVNTTIDQFDEVNLTYTYNSQSDSEIATTDISNDSLIAIGNYADQAGTQFTTLGIAITLILLVAVFLFFWKAFMGSGKKGKGGPEAGGSFA